MVTTPTAVGAGVQIALEGATLDGDLQVPAGATGLVIFAHGSGSGRHSSRNRHVAAMLNEAGFATLLLDLLTPTEEVVDLHSAHLRFDIPMLARRLVGAARWAARDSRVAALPIGYFGASTGGGAALVAAAELPETIRAVVSRGGRPDLAGDALQSVLAPTRLIVGGHDDVVITLNRAAMRLMKCEVRMDIIPGATHLFEEPGALDQVAALAAEWFRNHLPAP